MANEKLLSYHVRLDPPRRAVVEAYVRRERRIRGRRDYHGADALRRGVDLLKEELQSNKKKNP